MKRWVSSSSSPRRLTKLFMFVFLPTLFSIWHFNPTSQMFVEVAWRSNERISLPVVDVKKTPTAIIQKSSLRSNDEDVTRNGTGGLVLLMPRTTHSKNNDTTNQTKTIDIIPPENTLSTSIVQARLRTNITRPTQLFHLIHTTSEESFGTMQQRCLESIFYHHPDAQVLLHVKNMSDQPVQYIINAGYDLQLRQYHPVTRLKRMQNLKIVSREVLQNFVDQVDEYANDSQGYWYSNESNLLRMILMYMDGGIYLDTDTIVVRSMDDLPPNTIGFQDKSLYALNGAVLKFEKGHEYIRACLQEFLTHFNNRVWGANGPELLTRVYFSRRGHWNLTTVNPYYFQYFSFQRIQNDCYQDIRDYKLLHRMNGIREKSYVVHLNNQVSRNIVQGSPCDCLRNTFCLSARPCAIMDPCRALLEKPKPVTITTGVKYLDDMNTTDILSIPLLEVKNWTTIRPQHSSSISLKIFLYNSSDISNRLSLQNVQDVSMIAATQFAFLTNLFSTYPGRTYDPADADLFLVPLSISSSFVTCPTNCTIAKQSLHPGRHLFFVLKEGESLIASSLEWLFHSGTNLLSLLLVDLANHEDDDRNNIPIPIPPFNSHTSLQPSALLHRPLDFWSHKTRKYSLVANDISVDDYKPSILWHQFLIHVKDWKTVGDRPFLLVDPMEVVDDSEMLSYLQDSVFCPCFFKDDPTSFQRFFDAILSGCIPVIPQSSINGSTILEWIPYSTDIPYQEFVVQVDPVNISEGSMIQAIKDCLGNNATDLERRQSKLREHSLTLSYGFGRDAYVHDGDAFAHLIRLLEATTTSELPSTNVES